MQTINHLQKYLNAGYKLLLNGEMGKLISDNEIIEFYDNQVLNNYKNIQKFLQENNNWVEITFDFNNEVYIFRLNVIMESSNTIDAGLVLLNGVLESKNLTLKK